MKKHSQFYLLLLLAVIGICAFLIAESTTRPPTKHSSQPESTSQTAPQQSSLFSEPKTGSVPNDVEAPSVVREQHLVDEASNSILPQHSSLESSPQQSDREIPLPADLVFQGSGASSSALAHDQPAQTSLRTADAATRNPTGMENGLSPVPIVVPYADETLQSVASLPAVFAPPDAESPASPQEIEELTQQFEASLSEATNPDPADPEYQSIWRNAAREVDYIYRMKYGKNAWMQSHIEANR